MKYLIASDIHGSAFYCAQLLEALHREGADTLLLLGDLLYHGPRNDLPQGYAPKEVAAMLNGVQQRVFCVRGQLRGRGGPAHAALPRVGGTTACWKRRGKLVFATHGHQYNLQTPPALQPGDVLLHGHTHVPAKDSSAGFWYLNPGSVSIPKEGSAHSYMTLEDGVFRWKDLSGREYDSLTL